MPASKAQQKAVNKYMKENYDRFLATFKPKGRLDMIKAHAAACGESANAFINRAIDQAMAQDGAPEAAGGPHEARVVSLSSGTIKAAQQAAKAAGEDVSAFVARAVETQAQRDETCRKLKGGQ